jgi:hypothetical protein
MKRELTIPLLISILFYGCGTEQNGSLKEKSIRVNINSLNLIQDWNLTATSVTWDNAQNICQGEWRLPTKSDFYALLENNKTIDEYFGSDIKEYWFRDESNISGRAWKISTWNNTSTNIDKNSSLKIGVRCIKGEIDKNRAEIWWQFDTEDKMSYEEAVNYCSSKKRPDTNISMRLPTLYEFSQTTTLELTLGNENLTSFKNILAQPFGLFWSKTPLPTDENMMMTISATSTYFSDKNESNYVICVADNLKIPTIHISGEVLGDNPLYIKKDMNLTDPGVKFYYTINGEDNKTVTEYETQSDINISKVGRYEIVYKAFVDENISNRRYEYNLTREVIVEADNLVWESLDQNATSVEEAQKLCKQQYGDSYRVPFDFEIEKLKKSDSNTTLQNRLKNAVSFFTGKFDTNLPESSPSSTNGSSILCVKEGS